MMVEGFGSLTLVRGVLMAAIRWSASSLVAGVCLAWAVALALAVVGPSDPTSTRQATETTTAQTNTPFFVSPKFSPLFFTDCEVTANHLGDAIYCLPKPFLCSVQANDKHCASCHCLMMNPFIQGSGLMTFFERVLESIKKIETCVKVRNFADCARKATLSFIFRFIHSSRGKVGDVPCGQGGVRPRSIDHRGPSV